jgi:hypothetical protein
MVGMAVLRDSGRHPDGPYVSLRMAAVPYGDLKPYHIRMTLLPASCFWRKEKTQSLKLRLGTGVKCGLEILLLPEDYDFLMRLWHQSYFSAALCATNEGDEERPTRQRREACPCAR